MRKTTWLVPGLALFLARSPAGAGEAQVIPLEILPDRSQVVQTAYDPAARHIYAGTDRSVYRFRRDGHPKPERVVHLEPDARLVLLAGGRLYVLIRPAQGKAGAFAARLRPIDEKAGPEVDLTPKGAAFGLVLGTDDKLLVTRTVLGSPTALRTEERFSFLDAKGEVRGQRAVAGPRQWEVDPRGEALLLLGLEDARACSSAGQELWAIDGAFRHGALGPGGKTAILNPSPPERIRELIVRRASGAVASIALEQPAADLRISADGSMALVVLADARYVLLDTETMEPSPPRTLPVHDVRLISDAEIIDPQTLVFGVIHRTPQPDGEERTIIALSGGAQQNVLFTRKLPARSQTASLPAIDPAAGIRAFFARTDRTCIFVGLDG